MNGKRKKSHSLFGYRLSARFVIMLCCAALYALLCTGCAGKNPASVSAASDAPIPDEAVRDRRAAVAAIPAPDLPVDLRSSAPPAPAAQGDAPKQTGGLAYTVKILSPDPALVPPLEASSLLLRLRDTPPEDTTGLTRRILNDKDEAVKVLHSYGYYTGTIHAETDTTSSPVTVHLNLTPGSQYHLGTMPITYAAPAPQWKDAPRSLEDVGLKPGQPAKAADVLDAVSHVEKQLRDHGYPFARLEQGRYIVDHEKHVLEAHIRIHAGSYATMGRVVAQGTDTVDPAYFNRMRNWKDGTPWNASLLDTYREALVSQGLFRTLNLQPAPEPGPDGHHAVLAEVGDAPPRTVTAGLRYDSDRGPGARFSWEHRNILGSGEHLRVSSEWWGDLQDVRGTFRIPAFLRRDQDFVAEAGMRNESTTAYDQTATWAWAGLERRFWDYWMGSVRVSAEGGTLRSNRKPRSAYSMVGLPLNLRRDSTNSLLDAVSGTRAALTIAPYTGVYGSPFTATLTRFDGSAYYDALGNQRLVLAARVSAGTIISDSSALPASLMFYSGGGGSVRGYDYQSLGPRDEDNNPLGGKALLETGLELRIKITEQLGIVPFLDGGNVYNTASDIFQPDLRWGAGLGFRYYTPIGPLRLDLATPLNRRKDDPPWQAYISVGQSF